MAQFLDFCQKHYRALLTTTRIGQKADKKPAPAPAQTGRLVKGPDDHTEYQTQNLSSSPLQIANYQWGRWLGLRNRLYRAYQQSPTDKEPNERAIERQNPFDTLLLSPVFWKAFSERHNRESEKATLSAFQVLLTVAAAGADISWFLVFDAATTTLVGWVVGWLQWGVYVICVGTEPNRIVVQKFASPIGD